MRSSLRAKEVTVDQEVWEQLLRCEGEPVLAVSLCRPKLPEERAALRRVERYYRRLAQVWKKRWTSALYALACEAARSARESSRPVEVWRAELHFTVTYQDEALLSLLLQIREQRCGGAVIELRQGDTWDLTTGAPRTLASFFPSARGVKRRLLAAAGEQIQERLAGGESEYYEDWPRLLRRRFSPERFYLTAADCLTFFYPPSVLSPPLEGFPTFSLLTASNNL